MDRWHMTFDLHTHTRLVRGGREVTHAVSTVEQVVLAARKRGLKAVGISNHGPGHVTYGLPMESLLRLKEERDRLQEKYPDIRILIGVEANIINASGRLDVAAEEFGRFDYVMAGYHYGVFGEQPLGAGVLHAGNWLWERSGGRKRLERKLDCKRQDESAAHVSRGLLAANTRRMVEAVLKNRPLVVTHPGDKSPCDIREVARACQETGTWLEINNFHRDLTVENLRRAAKYDVKFIIGSDAHRPERVGCFEEGLARLLEAGVELQRVVNLERGE